MYRTSEWVSLGHPDKIADYISSYILDRYLSRDLNTRYALEVMIKDNIVTLGGEVTSGVSFNDEELAAFARNAVNEIGYNYKYMKYWGAENTICGDQLDVYPIIGQQSSDISKGVDNSGWGDQGIFFGMATQDENTDYMPIDIWLARKIGMRLFKSEWCGLDIKTQVTYDDSIRRVTEVVVAAPLKYNEYKDRIVKEVESVCIVLIGYVPYKIYVNGTGSYVSHSTIADCGITGRKLAVDFYGGNCEIGGGSPWTKDWTKADVTLNAYARAEAVDFIRENPKLDAVKCRISCRIGSSEIMKTFTDIDNYVITECTETADPKKIARHVGIFNACYAEMCSTGLPYFVM